MKFSNILKQAWIVLELYVCVCVSYRLFLLPKCDCCLGMSSLAETNNLFSSKYIKDDSWTHWATDVTVKKLLFLSGYLLKY